MLAAAPFWEAKPPEMWDERELAQMLSDSPWAQIAKGSAKAAKAPRDVIVYFATAAPMEKAEAEWKRRARIRRPGIAEPEDPLYEEYRTWLEEHRATEIMVAIPMEPTLEMSDESEIRRMEKDSLLRAGSKKLIMTGHFPPTTSDPYLRIAFPRQVQLSDKNLVLELYLPGVPEPYRAAQFSLKDMVSMGKLEL